jgi:hypothetical protein
MNYPQVRLLLWFCILGICGLVACQETVTKTTPSITAKNLANSTAVRPISSASVPVTNVKAEHQMLVGAWLNVAYTDALRQSHSPREAYGHWGPSGITELLLYTRNPLSDSLVVNLLYNNHEGASPYFIIAKSGAKVFAINAFAEGDATEMKLRYKVDQPDTLLYVEERDAKTHRITNTAFRKLRGFVVKNDTLETPLAYFINQLNFAGTHLMTDSIGHTSLVRFTPTGRVYGWPASRTYQVNMDFTGPFHELNSVFFDVYQKNQREFVFGVHGDTIRFYRMHDDTITYQRQRGRLCYTLIRQGKRN